MLCWEKTVDVYKRQEDKFVSFRKTDTIIVASPIVSGTELDANSMENDCLLYTSLPVADILFYAAVAVSVASGAEYFLKLKDIVMETM